MCVVVFVVVRGRAHWRAACRAAGCQGLNRAASEVRFRGENAWLLQHIWSDKNVTQSARLEPVSCKQSTTCVGSNVFTILYTDMSGMELKDILMNILWIIASMNN